MSEIASLVITRLTLDTLRANFLSTYPYFSFAEARPPPDDNHNHRVPIESRIWSFVVISLLFPFVFGLQSLQLEITPRHVLSHDEKLWIMQPAVLFMNSNYWKAYMLLEEPSWLLSINTIESSMSSILPQYRFGCYIDHILVINSNITKVSFAQWSSIYLRDPECRKETFIKCFRL